MNEYQIYRQFELRLDGLLLEKKSLIRERDTWIRKSGPKEVRSQSFDMNIEGVTLFATEPEVLSKIQDLTDKIAAVQECISIEEEGFNAYKTRIRQTRKDLEEHGCPDTTLIVFDEAYLKKKSNEQIAKDNFIPLGTVFNKRTEINRMMASD